MKDKLKIFKDEFNHWADILGLQGWDCYFEEVDIPCFAQIKFELSPMTATVMLSEKLDDIDEIKSSAKHEALHLFLGRVTSYTYERFANPEEINAAIEEVVNKLVRLL